jgi:shikimate dehydrogenase
VKRLAVIGHPIEHSRSPAMQTAALRELALDREWSYEAIDAAPDQFAERVGSMPGEGFVGANVTVPHKLAALELAHEVSRTAAEIGAANTLSFEDGRISADNTDAIGLIAALPAAAGGKRALVLGAGGAARAAVWGLASEGAEVEVWNRTGPRAEDLASVLDAVAVAEPTAADYGLIVNATTAGMAGGPPLSELPLDPSELTGDHVVVDLAYGESETELVAAARERGAAVADGLEVLVRQGAESLRIWTGEDPPLEAMREAARGG